MAHMRNVSVLLVSFLALSPFVVSAQDFAPPQSAPPGYVQQTDPNAAPPPPGQVPPQQVYTPQQIEQLVAPIALYPDPLISQVLMASTYPLEIVEAQRWLQNPQNAHLTGPALQAAMDQEPWDPSVKSLAAFPQVISMMDKNLQWTEQLGDAFLASQPSIMDSVQALRQKAQAAGNLASTPQQVVQQQQGAIVIEPANPQVIYVPYYNPTVVYGPWPWAAYPPYYFPPPPGYVAFNTGLFGFSIGFGIVEGLWGWDHWDWHRHEIIVDDRRYAELNRGRPANFAGNAWAHDPDHRHGVPYHSAAVSQRFQTQATEARQGYRGYFNSPNRAATPNSNFHQAAVPTATPAARSFTAPQAHTNSLQSQAQAQTHAAAEPRLNTVAPTQHTTQRAAPMFESFSHGSDVRTQAARGSFSRASAPVSRAAPQQHQAAPQQHAPAGGNNGGGHEHDR